MVLQTSRHKSGFFIGNREMFDDKDRPEYHWIHGGKVKHSYEYWEELRDEDGEVVPGCFRTPPMPSSDDL